MDIYSVYKVTNRDSLMTYIGFTSQQNTNRRWTEHKTISRNPNDPNHQYIHRAMNKYGVDQFSFEIIYQSTDGKHTLDVMESYFIKEYDAFGKNGYNLSPGGTAPMLGRKHKPETIELFNQRRHTDETKAKMSVTRKGQKKPTEYAAKMSDVNGQIWKVIHPDGTEETIRSMNRFCRENGLTPTHMGKVARGLQDNHKGYRCTKA